MMRVSHDYHRGGALAYLAAYDVHRAKIYGRCDPTTGLGLSRRSGDTGPMNAKVPCR